MSKGNVYLPEMNPHILRERFDFSAMGFTFQHTVIFKQFKSNAANFRWNLGVFRQVFKGFQGRQLFLNLCAKKIAHTHLGHILQIFLTELSANEFNIGVKDRSAFTNSANGGAAPHDLTFL